MKNKIFFFDMDGTLLDKDSKVPFITREALKEARTKGHKVAIATGRPLSEITTKVNADEFDYLIANNGTYYFDTSLQKTFSNGFVSKKTAFSFLEISMKSNSIFAVHSNGKAYRGLFSINKSEGAEVDGMMKEPIQLEDMKDIINKYDITQISLQNDFEIITKIANENKAILNNEEVHVSNKVFLDVVPKGVTKFSCIKKILKKENMDIRQSVSFGDSGNDLQMIEGCGIGIAMGNSTEQLKAIADKVIGNNDTNAIAIEIRTQIEDI